MDRKTRKEKVLEYLENSPGWVFGWELTNGRVGGTEGLRRLRELRAEGHPIEIKRVGSNFAYRYGEESP